MKNVFFSFFILFYFPLLVMAQDDNAKEKYENKKLNFEFIEKDLKYIILELEKEIGIKCKIEGNVNLSKKGSFTVKDIKVKDFLNVLSDYFDVDVSLRNNILVIKKSKKTLAKNILIFICLICLVVLFYYYIKVKKNLGRLDDMNITKLIEKADESKLLEIIKKKDCSFVFKVLSLNKLFEIKTLTSKLAIIEFLQGDDDILFRKIVFEKIKENYNLGSLNDKKYEDLNKDDFAKIKDILITNNN